MWYVNVGMRRSTITLPSYLYSLRTAMNRIGCYLISGRARFLSIDTPRLPFSTIWSILSQALIKWGRDCYIVCIPYEIFFFPNGALLLLFSMARSILSQPLIMWGQGCYIACRPCEIFFPNDALLLPFSTTQSVLFQLLIMLGESCYIISWLNDIFLLKKQSICYFRRSDWYYPMLLYYL